jgi:murein DD-endopeptidase MepM/ murein hydrolase activator NlpD
MRLRLLVAGLATVSVLALATVTSLWWVSRSPAPDVAAEDPAVEPEASEPAEAPAERQQTVEVRRGDNLVAVLIRAGLQRAVGHEIAAALSQAGADLRRLKPGDAIDITWSPADEATSVSWQESPWRGYAAVAGESGWEGKVLETTPDVRVATVHGRVERSLFHAIEEAGEQPQLVIALVNIFEWDFDFTADTRAGDHFRLVVEKRYASDTFVSYGRVLAAQYRSERRLLTGIAFAVGQRFAYYDADGRSLRKMFLKSPLAFTRITSGFTYARPHPIMGGTRPHLAVDYAAPTGTPVRAVADGVVVKAGWDGGYGQVVRIRHRAGYETLYAHLSRFGRGIHRGARVSQRQVVGHVGTTGLSTGPHLHYEVIKGGSRVNPLGEKFIPGEPIPAARRAEFERDAASLIERLEAAAPF